MVELGLSKLSVFQNLNNSDFVETLEMILLFSNWKNLSSNCFKNLILDDLILPFWNNKILWVFGKTFFLSF